MLNVRPVISRASRRIGIPKGAGAAPHQIGSTRAARRAGSQPASAATASNKSVASAIVSGSVAVNPNSRLSINFVVASAAASPIASPHYAQAPRA